MDNRETVKRLLGLLPLFSTVLSFCIPLVGSHCRQQCLLCCYRNIWHGWRNGRPAYD